jgi:hypothetical protein
VSDVCVCRMKVLEKRKKKSKILLGCGKKNRVKTKIFACPEKIPSHPCPHLYWKNS